MWAIQGIPTDFTFPLLHTCQGSGYIFLASFQALKAWNCLVTPRFRPTSVSQTWAPLHRELPSPRVWAEEPSRHLERLLFWTNLFVISPGYAKKTYVSGTNLA